MKITIKNESKSSEIKYPCLMTNERGSIVLFLSYGIGTFIKSFQYPSGYYSANFNMDGYTPFSGTIELSND